MPNVIFIEPEYTDGPHVDPNDDHAPTEIQPGQAFLADLYNTLISNPARWPTTLLLITYDEHGGFFDHVPPLDIPATVCGTQLPTTGVRVPALLISPFVKPGSVFNGLLDHTSLLQLLDDRFVKGEGYSVAVNERQKSLNRILNALTDKPNNTPPAPVDTTSMAKNLAPEVEIPVAPDTANARAIQKAAQKMSDEYSDALKGKGWEKLNTYLATAAAKPAA